MKKTQETRVQSLGWEGPLEEETATHSSILAWKIPQTEKPGELQSMGSQTVRHDRARMHTDTERGLFTNNKRLLSLSLKKCEEFLKPCARAKDQI